MHYFDAINSDFNDLEHKKYLIIFGQNNSKTLLCCPKPIRSELQRILCLHSKKNELPDLTVLRHLLSLLEESIIFQSAFKISNFNPIRESCCYFKTVSNCYFFHFREMEVYIANWQNILWQ